MTISNTFDPVQYSLEECQFLIKWLGQPPTLALRDIRAAINPNPARNKEGKIIEKDPTIYPEGVVPGSVRPILERVYELNELQKQTGEQWVGVEAVKACLQVYLEQAAKWQRDKLRGAPRFPSMHSFDTKGRPHRGGPGSDSGRVRTYFTATGERKPLAIFLLGDPVTGWMPEWAKDGHSVSTDVPSPESGMRLNEKDNRWECFCGHTEHFKPESRASQNSARARMAKHLLKATDETDKHREIHTNEFSS